MIIAVKRRWILAVAVTIALGACGTKRPEPGGQAEPRRGEDIPALAPDLGPVIVAFGDSLSAGFGVEAGKSYPDDLQRLIDEAGYKFHIVNMGVSGDTTTDGIQRLPDVIAANPVIVILEFGGNDGLRGLPVSTTRANQIQMIEALHSAGIQVLLAGMSLPRNYGPDYIRSFEQVYVDLAAEYHLARIPFLLEGVGGHPELLQNDGIHPTAEGCNIVASNVMRYLKPLLKR